MRHVIAHMRQLSSRVSIRRYDIVMLFIIAFIITPERRHVYFAYHFSEALLIDAIMPSPSSILPSLMFIIYDSALFIRYHFHILTCFDVITSFTILAAIIDAIYLPLIYFYAISLSSR